MSSSVQRASVCNTSKMLLDTTGDMLGTVGRDIVNVLLLTSLFACVLSFHNVIARYQFVLAGKGLLPARLARIHGSHESPAFSSVVQTITAGSGATGSSPGSPIRAASPPGGSIRSRRSIAATRRRSRSRSGARPRTGRCTSCR